MRLRYVLIPLALTACGPRYHTEYVLTPPASPAAKNCANQCYYVRAGCVNACENSQGMCRASDSGFHGSVGYGHGFGRRHGPWTGVGYGSPYHDSIRNCSYEKQVCEESCEGSYRACFTQCGGQVQPITRCVENCPPATQM